ncbi:MAG: trigger factor [Candidatus Aminicenantes bacterium]|nr:trigger factor [Candidatus Aminicenantes bacterium]
MKSELKQLSRCKRELKIEIPAEKVKEEHDKIVDQFMHRTKIKGFRPGKAPKNVIKNLYSEDIQESLINSMAPKAIHEELKRLNLTPVASPVLKKFDYEEGKSLNLTTEFEILPEFDLPEYKKIKIKEKEVKVSDQEIQDYLQELQKRAVQYIPVEGRSIEADDYVIIELKSSDVLKKKAFPKENVAVLVGHPENEKALNDNILGMKAQEEKVFTVDYPSDHNNKKVAGKKVEYTIKILSIKQKKVPDIDDEFAKEMGEFDDLKSLKEEIKKNFLETKKSNVKHEKADEIINKIAEKINFELPESLVQQETIIQLRRMVSMNPQNSNLKEEDVKKMREEAKDKAGENLKKHIILMKIADLEKIKVEDTEVADEMREISKKNNIPYAQLVEQINREGKREDLRNNLLIKKTVDFLLENAIIYS